MNFAGTTCLVTGATGLLGGHVVQALLARSARVVVLVRDEVPGVYLDIFRPRVHQVRGDLLDLPLLQRLCHEYGVTHIFHLAAQTQVPAALNWPLSTWESNVRGTWLLLEAARSLPHLQGVVVASSDKVYGPTADLPYRETQALRPVHPYDASKACVELVARSYEGTYGLPVVVTRCGNLYGPGDLNWDRLIPGTLRDLESGCRPFIRSDGSPRRDYVFVGDVVGAVLQLALRAAELKGEVFNLGSGRPTTVLEVVGELRRQLGKETLEPDIRGVATQEHADQYLDSTRAREILGWQAVTSLSDGIAQTLPWYHVYFSRTPAL